MSFFFSTFICASNEKRGTKTKKNPKKTKLNEKNGYKTPKGVSWRCLTNWLPGLNTFLLDSILFGHGLIRNRIRFSFWERAKKASDQLLLSFAISLESIKNFKKIRTQFCSIFNSLKEFLLRLRLSDPISYFGYNNSIFWITLS